MGETSLKTCQDKISVFDDLRLIESREYLGTSRHAAVYSYSNCTILLTVSIQSAFQEVWHPCGAPMCTSEDQKLCSSLYPPLFPNIHKGRSVRFHNF
jgi:hypothetical protein